MKSFFYGIFAAALFVLVGFYLYRNTNLSTKLLPTPTPLASPIPTVSPSPTPTVSPSAKPAPTYTPVKSGAVKGTSTSNTTTTTTTTTTHLLLTLIKTNECKSYMTEVRDITSPLTLRYTLKDGYKATVTAWKQNGEEVISQREIVGSGELKKIEGLTYLKLQTQPAICNTTSDTWLTLTAQR